MYIALVTYALQVGGVETFLKLLAKYFESLGHEVVFVEALTKGKQSEAFVHAGYEVKRILQSPLRSRFHHVKRIAESLKDYDLIILNDAPFAQSILGLLSDKTVAIPVLHMFMTSMVRNAVTNMDNWDMLSAVSPAVRDSAIHYGADGRRTVCIPNGVEVPDEWPKIGHDFKHTKPLRVAYIGAINHIQKGVLYLPGIFKKVLSEHVDINLDIVGDGDDIRQLSNQIKEDDMDKNIVFHGALPNNRAIEILRRSDILILPSHFEGLPMVLLEAMSLGVVPVVSRLSGCTDFVMGKEADNLLVEIGNENGFAEALIKLANDRLLLKALSLEVWKTARNRFSYTTMGSAYLKLTEKCLESRQRGEIARRSGKIEKTLLGDLPWLPIIFVRIVRKVLRILGLFPSPTLDPMLYVPGDK